MPNMRLKPTDLPSPSSPRRPDGFAVLFLVAAGALLIWSEFTGAFTNDAYWQLVVGRWMVAHHAVLGHDILSYASFGQRWVNVDWGWELAVYASWLAVGAWGLALVAGLVNVATMAVTAATCRRLGVAWRSTSLIVFGAAVYLGPGLSARAQDASFLFFAVELYVIFGRAQSDRRWLAAIPFLMALWVNGDGAVILGLAVLVGVTAVAWLMCVPSFQQLADPPLVSARWPLTIATGASLLASLVSPWGVGALITDVRLATVPSLTLHLPEWLPPAFNTQPFYLILALAPLVGLVIAATRRRLRVDISLALMSLALLAMSLRSVRLFPFFGLGFAVLVAQTTASTGVEQAGTLSTRLRALQVFPAALLVALAASSVLSPPSSIATYDQVVPQRLFTLAGHQPGGLLTTQGISAWVVWNDGLHPLMSTSDLPDAFGQLENDYVALELGSANPAPILARWRVRTIVWLTPGPLAVWLTTQPCWHRLASQDHWGLWGDSCR